MAESKGPEKPAPAEVPGKVRRRGPLQRMRPYAVSAVVMAVVFGGSAVIGAHVRAKKDDSVKAPAGAAAAPVVVPTGPAVTGGPTARPTGPKLAVPVHPSVPVTVTVYEYLRSPDSKAFADAYGPMLDQLLTTGQVELHYRLVTASDAKYGGKGSQEAASAAACAADQGRFTQFVAEVFRDQPSDPDDDVFAAHARLKHLADKAHKIKSSTFEPCLDQGDHVGWVRESQEDFAASGLGDAPAVQIGDQAVKGIPGSMTPQKLHTLILAEVKRVVAARMVTPTPANTLLS